MQKLSRKLGEVSYDNLFAGTSPKPRPAGGVLRKGDAVTELKRGTATNAKSGSLPLDIVTPRCRRALRNL